VNIKLLDFLQFSNIKEQKNSFLKLLTKILKDMILRTFV